MKSLREILLIEILSPVQSVGRQIYIWRSPSRPLTRHGRNLGRLPRPVRACRLTLASAAKATGAALVPPEA